MQNKGSYHTRQSEELRSYLENAGNRHVTAGDICEYFRLSGRAIGAATVYRQLEKLVDEGFAVKYVTDPGAPACYEYLGHNPGETACYHCKCQVCGKLIHMQCEELEDLGRHLMEHHGFSIDPLRTVFWGICRECAGAVQCEQN